MRSRQPCQALLLDLDGVLRESDPDHVAEVERRHGLAPGSLESTAFQWGRWLPAITGRVSHQEWVSDVASALATPTAADAVAEWLSHPGGIRSEVRDLVREARHAGLPVAVAANATDRLDTDLAELGLRDEFDAVVNSSRVGHHKPTREFFAAACQAVGVVADRCLFVADDHRDVMGARAAGLAAYRFSEPADLRYVRAALLPALSGRE